MDRIDFFNKLKDAVINVDLKKQETLYLVFELHKEYRTNYFLIDEDVNIDEGSFFLLINRVDNENNFNMFEDYNSLSDDAKLINKLILLDCIRFLDLRNDNQISLNLKMTKVDSISAHKLVELFNKYCIRYSESIEELFYNLKDNLDKFEDVYKTLETSTI